MRRGKTGAGQVWFGMILTFAVWIAATAWTSPGTGYALVLAEEAEGFSDEAAEFSDLSGMEAETAQNFPSDVSDKPEASQEEAGNFQEIQDIPAAAEQKPDTETPDDKVYLGIDNLHIYEGMEQSFSDGYRPTIKDGNLELVIPYVASGKMKWDKLTVNLEFGSQKESPVELKNYQKDVWKKGYLPVEGIMEEYGTGAGETAEYLETYLYECKVPIRDSAEPGQYSVTVRAWGYTENMDQIKLDYNIFFRIPEAEPVFEDKPEPEKEPERSSEAEAENGNQSGGGYAGGGGYSGSSSSAEEIIRQPKMLLESCNLSEKELEAGSKETMTATLQNRSRSQSMYNLKVILQPESPSIRLERNSFYFERVAPGESIGLEDKVEISPDAEAGAVPLTFLFEYEDKKGNSASGTEMINLTVSQPVKIELEKAEFPSFVYASDTVELPITVLNLGRASVYNARIRLEGTGLFPTGDVFIGNMEAGTSGEGSMKIYVGTRTMEAIGADSGTDDSAKYGEVSGKITLSYEDASGDTHEISRDYQTEIKKAQILSLNIEDEKESGNPWWLSVFAVLILGMFVLILLLFARLRRKNVLLEEARKA